MLPVLGIYRKSLQQTVFGSCFLWNKRTRKMFFCPRWPQTRTQTPQTTWLWRRRWWCDAGGGGGHGGHDGPGGASAGAGGGWDITQTSFRYVAVCVTPTSSAGLVWERGNQPCWPHSCHCKDGFQTLWVLASKSNIHNQVFFGGVYNPETNSVASESYHPAHILIRTTQKPPGSCELGMFTEVWFVHQQEAPSLSGSVLFAVDPAILGMVTLQRHFNGHSLRCISHPSFQPNIRDYHGLSY